MKRLTTFLSAFAIVASGFGIVAVSTWNNLEMLAGRSIPLGQLDELATNLNSVTAVPLAVALFTPVLMVSGFMALRRRQIVVAAFLLLSAFGGVAFDMATSLDRVALNSDEIKHGKRSHNAKLAAARDAVTRWEDRLALAKAGIARECGGKDPATLSDQGWPNCRRFYAASQAAQSSLDQALAQRDSLGADVVEDSGAQIAQAAFGIPAARWATYRPIFPVIFLLGGSFLVSFGLSLATPVRVPSAQPQTATAERPMRDVTPASLVGGHEPVLVALRQIGRPVNNRELAQTMGWSEATAHRRVKALEEQGFIRKNGAGNKVAIEIA